MINAALRDGIHSQFLAGGGGMTGLILSRDWSNTPLGPIETWPQSLRTTVSLCLASNFPINIIWGPGHTQIYNDGYRVVCGDAHPAALGQDYSVTWASAWPAIGEPFARALSGETTFLENQRMFLTRNGYLEETFFTFSTSPIRDESGGIGGLFHPVTETTATILAERRTRALRDLTAGLAKAADVADLVEIALKTLAGFSFDLPFVLVYGRHAETGAFTLLAQAGIAGGTSAVPVEATAEATHPWPLAEAARSGTLIEVDGIATLLRGAPCGPYNEPPNRAVVMSVAGPDPDAASLLLVAGVSPRLPFNDAYRGFYELLAAALAAALSTVSTREAERRRAEALAELDRAKTVFFSNVSHEFRTPLTLLLGPLEDAMDLGRRLAPAQRERLGIAHRNALRLLKLVNALLDFSRIEAGRTEAHFEPVDLALVTADLASSFRSACERAGLDLVVDCLPLSRAVFVDRDMWEKIVLNLLSNAFKFTLEGSIRIAVTEAAGGVVLSVADTGVGIPTQELPRLFERFHRIEGQKSRTHEGSGIGLSLVHELVALHGGTVVVESDEGRGTRFDVHMKFGAGHLPPDQLVGRHSLAPTAIRPDAFVAEAMRWLPDEAPVARTARAEASGAGIADRPRLILADDNADMRAYVRTILEQGGYDVVAVENGAAALAAARECPELDVILSDVMMPRMDGFALLDAIRADPALEGVLVLLLSARAGEEARLEGLAAGADDYIVKPFSARELRARVDGAVRLARQRRDAATRERDLQTAVATAQSRASLRDAEQTLDLAIEAGRLGLWTLDLSTGAFTASAICRADFGRDAAAPFSYEELVAAIHADDRPRQQAAVARAIDTKSDLDIEYRVHRPDGDVAWVLTRGRAEYGADGAPLRITGVSLDITDRKRAEDRQRLMRDELNHRVKNTLATVQSIARQTQRAAESPAAFVDALEARFGALARAHDLLNLTSWEGARLKDVIVQTLAPYSTVGKGEHRLDISGPPIRLGPNAAVTLNMAFHELTTNAAKYGALSRLGGRVDVTWAVDRERQPPSIEILWTERDGPRVDLPTRRGFGSRLLEQGLAREMNGEVTLRFDPAGLSCRMRLEESSKIEALV